ncbi:hypothetical protein L7F22_029244 [Adiantum nelumboides]|nr:hypothetical protein [Adiantum nelumboides]
MESLHGVFVWALKAPMTRMDVTFVVPVDAHEPMDGLMDYSSSSSFDNETSILQRENGQSPHTPHEESEVSSSVVQEDRPQRTDILAQNPVLTLSELGCTFEEIGHALSVWGPETKMEELYDFIQARKCSLEEDFNSAEVPVQEKDARMQETMEPCPSFRLHITNTCGDLDLKMNCYRESWILNSTRLLSMKRLNELFLMTCMIGAGSNGKEEFTMQTEGRTGEASCHRIPHIILDAIPESYQIFASTWRLVIEDRLDAVRCDTLVSKLLQEAQFRQNRD